MPIEFIALLGIELNMLDQILEPQDEMQPGDQIQGEISEDLRKLYTLWKLTGSRAGALQNELRWGPADPEKATLAHEFSCKAGVINVIFWAAVQDELHLWHSKEPLAIRKGFKVVIYKEGSVPMFQIMGGLG